MHGVVSAGVSAGALPPSSRGWGVRMHGVVSAGAGAGVSPPSSRVWGVQMSEASLLEVEALTARYRGQVALYQVHFRLPLRSITGIVGPNGAGKSTLLKSLLGFLPTTSGRIAFFGRPFKEVARRIAYVPQRESVEWDFPIDVLSVVLMGCYPELRWWQRIGKRHRDWAMNCLEKVGMEGCATRQIGELSVGQQQRVFLARALAQKSDVYLMDEPFAGVDAASEGVLRDLFKQLQKEGKSLLVVHHDLSTVADYFDHVLLLNLGVIACGKTQEVFTQANLKATYKGKLSLLSLIAHAR